MYPMMVNSEQLDQARLDRLNDFAELFFQWVAPKPRFRDQYDRFCYMLIYLGDRMDYFNAENSERARKYLKDFPPEDIRRMQ